MWGDGGCGPSNLSPAVPVTITYIFACSLAVVGYAPDARECGVCAAESAPFIFKNADVATASPFQRICLIIKQLFSATFTGCHGICPRLSNYQDFFWLLPSGVAVGGSDLIVGALRKI